MAQHNDTLQARTAELPIWPVMPTLREQLDMASRAVLVAPPGAGKSSIVPLALLESPWLAGGRILLLEPRRLAARNLAWRMAELLGEELGQTVGLRTRDETRVGPRTRIEVLTEALLTRRLQAQPELEGVGLVIFDEFHERSLHADLGLALARDVQQGLREDLRLLLMSATLDDTGLARELDAAVLRSEGRSYPVEIRHQPVARDHDMAAGIARVVRQVLREESGSLLVFLPGESEIRRLAGLLTGLPADCRVQPLYGRLPREAQQAAIAPAPAGQRKIVLATTVAETSLTIAGVRVVIDAGLARVPVFDPNAGFTHLVTRRVSQDAADQRAGRAGRLEPGLCLRLWSSEESLAPLRTPEIRSSDLAATALNAAAWGSEPAWLEAPPAGPWAQARELLRELRLTDAQGRITAAGRQVVEWGAHPRIGRLLLDAPAAQRPMACDLAALLEADRRGGDEIDIHQLWLAWRRGGAAAPVRQALDRESARWRRRLGLGKEVVEADPGVLLAPAFADRIALARGERGSYQLALGRGARLPSQHPLAGQEWLVVPDLDGRGEGRIRLAAAYTRETLERQFGDEIGWQPSLRFNPSSGGVDAREQLAFRRLQLQQRPLPRPQPEDLRQALLDGIRTLGVERLAWRDEAESLRLRLDHLAQADTDWPACDFASLQAALDDWLGPWLSGLRRLDALQPALLASALKARLSPSQRGRLEQLAPAAFTLPGGRRCKLDYAAEDGPVLAVRMQDLYGQDATPLVAGRPVLLHLLSPARRPLAVTRDLPSFWRNAYPEVRKQMRGRYPKHDWPERPWEAPPAKSR